MKIGNEDWLPENISEHNNKFSKEFVGSCNEKNRFILACINVTVEGNVDVYTCFPPEAMITILEKYLTAVKRGMTTKQAGSDIVIAPANTKIN